MLAGRQDLPADGDDAVGGHRSIHPLVTRAIDSRGGVERQVGREGASTEALERRFHAQLLVRSIGVVFVHPRVEFLLKVLKGAKGVLAHELTAQRVVPPFNLAGGGGMSWLSESMRDPVLSTDLVKEHLGVVASKSPGEDLAVVRQYFLGHPPTRQGRHE